jgi:hypothetical protein
MKGTDILYTEFTTLLEKSNTQHELCFFELCFFEPRFIRPAQAEVSKRQYSSKANGSNVRDFLAAKNTVRASNFRDFAGIPY